MASPAVAQVHHPVLAPAQLSAQLRLACQEKQTNKQTKNVLVGFGNGLRGRSVRFGFPTSQKRSHVLGVRGRAGSPRRVSGRDSLTVQQHIPQGAALQGQARQPGGVVLPHTQPQVLGALQPARVSLLQLQTATRLHRSGSEDRLDASCHLQVLCCGTFKPN